MKLIEAPEQRPWPKFTEDALIAVGEWRGKPKPVFVMPVLVRSDDGGVAWHSVHMRIGGLKGQQGAVFNSHAPADARAKAHQLLADADKCEGNERVTFMVVLKRTFRRATLTPTEARQVARAIEEARVILANHPDQPD